jgi:ribonuclease G
LPWFRFLKKDRPGDAAAAAAVTETDAPAELPEEDEKATASEELARKRRRRGSRGGRGRKKPAPGETAEAEAVPAPPEPAEKPEKTARRSRSTQRRRQPPRRAPLPQAKRELLISTDIGEQRVAVIEDGKVTEVYLERPERRSIAGNIYLGTVDNVLPGMEAAFVEIGLEKNGFLYVDEIVVPELEGKRHGKKITDLIQRGQVLLVQAVKDPMKSKGARLTTEISLPGRFLVYVPYGEGLGVSRRLDEAERSRLKDILKGLSIKEGGIIVRTAAEGASASDVERDLVFLQRLWKTIQAHAKNAGPPELLYQEAELPLRIVRDLFAGGFEAAHVDSDKTFKRIVGYLKKTSPDMLERVHRFKEKEPLFERYGVEQEIASTLERRVDLPSGGYLIFDYAEAFTVIDVNTGRFVGSRAKSSTQRLEDTIVKNNLEAVKEVVRQLRLRDIGGIIVIDFIDMANPKNRQAVEEALRTELERDRTKTYVVEISPLGLVEMTRQNVTDGPREVMTRKCQTCGGDGIVVSDTTVALHVERRLRTIASDGARGVQAYKISLHPRVLMLLAGPGGARLHALEEATKRRFFLVGADGHVHMDHVQVLAEGKTADLTPASPVAPGASLEVKLVEVGLHDPTAGVGAVDGVTVTVADAARLVGKKTTVTVGAVLEGQAFATLPVEKPPLSPITFESEAEKPTRAPARRTTPVSVEAETADEIPLEVAVSGVAAESPAPEAPVSEETDQAARKRTRRGSRGGKRRRKPAGVSDGETASAEDAEEPDEEAMAEPSVTAEVGAAETNGAKPPARRRRRTPKIHVPDAEAGNGSVDGEVAVRAEQAAAEEAGEEDESGAPPPRKKTRRGSRGGRSRRKRTAPQTDGETGGEGAPDTALEALDAPDGYVPMAEWIGDFERRS